MGNIIGIVASYAYIAVIIVLAKLFEKISKEASRKFIHIMLGNWWIIAMLCFDNVWFAAFAPATFVIINYLSYKKGIISVMERDDNQKEGLGTVYYAISLLILAIVTFGILHKPELGLVPVLVMAYGDGLAAVIGTLVKSKKYTIKNTTKSVAGSITMCVISFLAIAGYLLYIGSGLWWLKAIAMSVVITVIEAVSIKGTDNLNVPIGMLLMLLLV